MSERRASMDGPHDDGCPCPYCSQRSNATDPRPGPLPPLAASPPAAPGLPGRAGTSPRDEWIEAGVQAILGQYEPVAEPDDQLRADVRIVLDAVAPLIRAHVAMRESAAEIREQTRILAVLDAMAGQATGLDIYSHAQRLVLDQLRRRLTEDSDE